MANVDNVVELHQKRDFPSFDDTLRYREIQIDKNNNLIRLDEKEGKISWFIVGKEIKILEISKNIETQEITYNIEIRTFDNRKLELQGLKRKDLLDKQELLGLTAYGAEVNSRNVKYYIKSFENQEKLLSENMKNYHENIGWGKVDGKDIFKHEEALGIESVYQGELQIEKKGTVENWYKFLTQDVLGHLPLETAIAIGLSAVVVGYIGEEIGVNSQMIHLFGNSSTGKTSVAEIITSLATKPNMARNGLMYSWNSTTNALIGNIRDNYGLGIIFDDSSVSRLGDFSTTLYQLVQGRDKDRMDKEGNLRDTKTWRTTVVSTGEQSLIQNSNKNDGIRVRVIEFENVLWTKSAEHSERIKREVQKNYGLGVEIIAKKLLDLGRVHCLERIESIKDQCLSELKQNGKDHPLYPRMLNSVATIILAIEIFEEESKLGFDLEAIREFLLENILIDERTIGMKAYEDLLEYVAGNSNRFYRDIYTFDTEYLKKDTERKGLIKSYKKANSNAEVLGKIEDVEYEIVDKKIKTYKEDKENKDIIKVIKVNREISILRNKFDSILKDMGYQNPSGILKELKEKDLISCDGDRHTRKRKLTEEDSRSTVVVLKTVEEYEKLQVLNELERTVARLGFLSNTKEELVKELDTIFEEEGEE